MQNMQNKIVCYLNKNNLNMERFSSDLKNIIQYTYTFSYKCVSYL